MPDRNVAQYFYIVYIKLLTIYITYIIIYKSDKNHKDTKNLERALAAAK